MGNEIKPKKVRSLIGKSWSQYPPHKSNGDLNIVAGTPKVISDILSVILTKKGEASFFNPEYGVNPDFFSPLSEYDPDVFSSKVEEQIRTWVDTIESVSVSTSRSARTRVLDGLMIIINFRIINSPTNNLLTFDYYTYQGAIMENDIDSFLNNVAIEDERFKGLNNGN